MGCQKFEQPSLLTDNNECRFVLLAEIIQR